LGTWDFNFLARGPRKGIGGLILGGN